MVELFYFSNPDLMIKVEYVKRVNTLRYASHREMEHNEREMAEEYIMSKVAPKTEFHLKHPSNFVYLGTDKRLEKRLASFHQKNDLELLGRKEKEISASVDSLINDSMRNYYSEKIGDLIISVRSELKTGGHQYEAKFASLKEQLNALLSAYNTYTDRKVTLDTILPSDLKPHCTDLDESRYSHAPQ